jgi:hypothetical protein
MQNNPFRNAVIQAQTDKQPKFSIASFQLE